MIFGVQRRFLEFNGKFQGIKMISRVQTGFFGFKVDFFGALKGFLLSTEINFRDSNTTFDFQVGYFLGSKSTFLGFK